MAINRRELFRSLAGLALLAAGCACPPRRPPLIEWSEATGATFLAPNKVQSKPIPVVFDVHAHLFNATDVPVRGFLAGPVAHSLNPPLDDLVSAAAPIIEELSQLFAISCGEEMQILSEKLTRAKGMSGLSVNHDFRAEVDRDLERHLSKIQDQLERRLPGSDFGDKLDDAYRKYEMSRRKLSSGRTPSTGATLVSRSPELIRAGLTQGVNPSLSVKGKSTQEKASENLNPLGVLSLLRYMLTPRYLNLRAFQKAYSEDDGAFGVDCCFAALVDFDHWLGCAETSSSLHDQVLLHEQLAVLSGGYVLPIAPYNPISDIRQSNKSFELVEWAVMEHGFVGVKIYPPMGYLPLGNSTRSDSELSRSELSRKDARKLDERLRVLYGWCNKLEVPVMGHTAHSRGLDSEHDEFSKPSAWNQVFEEFPGLQVVGGHFGGDYHTDKGTDWPKEFALLMKEQNADGLNVDVAYLYELLDTTSEGAIRMRKLIQRHPTILKRLMYGSDWHMIAQEQNWGGYAYGMDAFLASLSLEDLAIVRGAFYFENAARCFGLTSNHPNANRSRLQAFYSKWKIATPAWMRQLDQK